MAQKISETTTRHEITVTDNEMREALSKYLDTDLPSNILVEHTMNVDVMNPTSPSPGYRVWWVERKDKSTWPE